MIKKCIEKLKKFVCTETKSERTTAVWQYGGWTEVQSTILQSQAVVRA